MFTFTVFSAFVGFANAITSSATEAEFHKRLFVTTLTEEFEQRGDIRVDKNGMVTVVKPWSLRPTRPTPFKTGMKILSIGETAGTSPPVLRSAEDKNFANLYKKLTANPYFFNEADHEKIAQNEGVVDFDEVGIDLFDIVDFTKSPHLLTFEVDTVGVHTRPSTSTRSRAAFWNLFGYNKL